MAHYENFSPGSFYHIFNHAVGNDNIFRSHDNYLFFLNRYNHYLFPVFKTFAYCLMPNHFHILVQVRDEHILKPLISNKEADFHKFIMQRLSNFLNSYAKAFNKQQSRRGSLFIDYTKRKEISNDCYFSKIINYIHQNPVHHGFCKEVNEWEYSSYNSIISINKGTKLERNIVFDWFGSIEHFVTFHKQHTYLDSEFDF